MTENRFSARAAAAAGGGSTDMPHVEHGLNHRHPGDRQAELLPGAGDSLFSIQASDQVPVHFRPPP